MTHTGPLNQEKNGERSLPHSLPDSPSTNVDELQERISSLDRERISLRAQLADLQGNPPNTATTSVRTMPSIEPMDPEDRVFDPAVKLERLSGNRRFAVWLGRAGIDTLRVALGAIFLGFGALKLVPGVSPAEDISRRTVDRLTFGLVSGDAATFLVGLLEVTIGLCLVSGKFLRLGLALLMVAMIGVLSPLVLFTDDLFAGKYHAPTLLGQYVLKDFVLLAAAVVIIARELARFVDESEKGEPEEPDVGLATYLDEESNETV